MERRQSSSGPHTRGRGQPRHAGIGIAAAAIVIATVPLVGCETEKSLYPGNLPPTTYLAIRGDSLNTTPYRTILDWWGSDADGKILGYAFRWDRHWSPGPGDSLWWEDSSWVFTTATRDTFDYPVRGTRIEATFEVRAIDNELLADPTPESQTYSLYNDVPLVTWTDTSRHPTHEHPSLPVASFAWTPEDYDGRRTIAYARLWLDLAGDEDSAASAITVPGSDTIGVFLPEHFQNRYGPRTVHLRLYDDAETPSDTTLTWSWTVIPPTGEYLLIDTAWPSNSSAAVKQDNFWRARMDALFPENYHIYDLEYEGAFRSAPEVLPIFSMFRGVVWYGIKHFSNVGGSSEPIDRVMREALALAEGSLTAYAERGGAIFLTAHNLIGTAGGLSEDFWNETLGISEIYEHLDDDQYISDTDLPGDIYVRCGDLFGGADSLLTRRSVPSSDFFAISDRLEKLLWVDPGVLDAQQVPADSTALVHAGAVATFGPGRVAFCTTLLTEFHSSSDPEEAVENLLRNLFGP